MEPEDGWPRACIQSLTYIDRTSELRKKGFQGRRLGPKQMTTDTAVRVARIVVQDKGRLLPSPLPSPSPSPIILIPSPTRLYPQLLAASSPLQCINHFSPPTVPLDKIPYDDFPELKFNNKESTEMPFRYVKGSDGKPIMPEVSTPFTLSHLAFSSPAHSPPILP